jgi:DNA-binding CsgD family transcriptional regulator
MILGVAAKTAETHRVKVMDKLDIHSTAGLVRYAIRRGLLEV